MHGFDLKLVNFIAAGVPECDPEIKALFHNQIKPALHLVETPLHTVRFRIKTPTCIPWFVEG